MPSLAETVYIGDTIYVPLRSGPGIEYRIIHRGVKTGTALTLLDQEKEQNYYQVKLPSGQEGYIPSQYIVFDLPAPMQLEKVRAENTELSEELAEANQKLTALQNDLEARAQDLATNTRNTRELTSELNQVKAISARSIELDQKNTVLRTANEELLTRVQTLEVDNQQLADNAKQHWFLYGAGTILLGLLIGLLAPSLRPKKKDISWV